MDGGKSGSKSGLIRYVQMRSWDTVGLWLELANSLWEMGLLLGLASSLCISVDVCFCLHR